MSSANAVQDTSPTGTLLLDGCTVRRFRESSWFGLEIRHKRGRPWRLRSRSETEVSRWLAALVASMAAARPAPVLTTTELVAKDIVATAKERRERLEKEGSSAADVPAEPVAASTTPERLAPASAVRQRSASRSVASPVAVAAAASSLRPPNAAVLQALQAWASDDGLHAVMAEGDVRTMQRVGGAGGERSSILVEAPPDVVLALLEDAERRTQWNPSAVEEVVVEQANPQTSTRRLTYHEQLPGPVLLLAQGLAFAILSTVYLFLVLLTGRLLASLLMHYAGETAAAIPGMAFMQRVFHLRPPVLLALNTVAVLFLPISVIVVPLLGRLAVSPHILYLIVPGPRLALVTRFVSGMADGTIVVAETDAWQKSAAAKAFTTGPPVRRRAAKTSSPPQGFLLVPLAGPDGQPGTLVCHVALETVTTHALRLNRGRMLVQALRAAIQQIDVSGEGRERAMSDMTDVSTVRRRVSSASWLDESMDAEPAETAPVEVQQVPQAPIWERMALTPPFPLAEHEFSAQLDTALERLLEEIDEDDEAWSFRKEDRGVKVFSKTTPGCEHNSMLGVARIDNVTPWALAEVARGLPTFDPQFEKGETVAELVEGVQVRHTKYKRIFPTASRDFCMVGQCLWKKDGSALIVGQSVEHAQCPPVSGSVRARLLIGGWQFLPVWDAQNVDNPVPVATDVRYMCQVDVGGSIPTRITNEVSLKQPLAIADLRDKALTPEIIAEMAEYYTRAAADASSAAADA